MLNVPDKHMSNMFSDEPTLSFKTDDIDKACCEACGLSRVNRLMIFGGCFIGGWALSWLAFFFLLTSASTFAWIYTLGNIVALSGSFFLMAPCAQLKSMCASTRVIATCMYIGMMIITLVMAFKGVAAVVVFLCSFLQFLAATWYTLSYIPFARACIKNCVSSIIRL